MKTKQKIKTVEELKGLLSIYFNDMSHLEYKDLIKKSLGAWTLKKPKDLETSFSQIDAWVNSNDENKTTLESYGKSFNVKHIFYPGSNLFE